MPRPDVIVASFPPIELAAAAVRLGRQFGVATVVDVRDLWPDVFRTMAGRERVLGAIAARAYDPLAIWTLRNATALTSITESMLDWALTMDCLVPRMSAVSPRRGFSSGRC